jgi:hypothetical protein
MLEKLILSSLKTERKLSALTSVFAHGPLLRALEKLVNRGAIICRYDGRDYHYRLA